MHKGKRNLKKKINYKYCVTNALRNGNLINIQVPWGFCYGIQDFHMIEIWVLAMHILCDSWGFSNSIKEQYNCVYQKTIGLNT